MCGEDLMRITFFGEFAGCMDGTLAGIMCALVGLGIGMFLGYAAAR